MGLQEGKKQSKWPCFTMLQNKNLQCADVNDNDKFKPRVFVISYKHSGNKMNLYVNTHPSEHPERILGGTSATLYIIHRCKTFCWKSIVLYIQLTKWGRFSYRLKKFQVSAVKEQQKITVPYFGNIVLVLMVSNLLQHQSYIRLVTNKL